MELLIRDGGIEKTIKQRRDATHPVGHHASSNTRLQQPPHA